MGIYRSDESGKPTHTSSVRDLSERLRCSRAQSMDVNEGPDHYVDL